MDPGSDSSGIEREERGEGRDLAGKDRVGVNLICCIGEDLPGDVGIEKGDDAEEDEGMGGGI